MELVDVVLENGEYTGEVVERSEAQKRGLGHWEVIIFIVNDKGEILLQKRSANKKYYPNKWAVCSGLVISGETVIEGAIRELKEEVGVDFSLDEVHVLEENVNLTRFYYVFCNKKEDEFVIQENELSCVKWFNIKKILKMIEEKDDSLVINDRIYKVLLKLINEVLV